MSLAPPPVAAPIESKPMSAAWRAWFSNLFLFGQALGTNGPTASRPQGTPAAPLYIGFQFFDSTLGYPVWVKSLNPTVWVNATGAAV